MCRPLALIRLSLTALAVLGVAAPIAAHAQGSGGARRLACSARPPGGDWPVYGHDDANTRSQPEEHSLSAARAAGLVPAWTATTVGGLQSTPVVAGGCVYLTTTTGAVYALDAATGRPVWRTTLPVSAAGALGGDIPGAPAVAEGRVYVLVSQDSAPYAAALDMHTGRVLWRSAPVTTQPGAYTNASAAVHDGLLLFGYSPPEGADHGQGGVSLIDIRNGSIVADVPTVPLADQKQGYAGGGIWSTPAFDGAGYAYLGAGNPFSKSKQDRTTDAIIKIDIDRARATFGQIVAAYQGQVDQYDSSLQALAQTPVCAASDTGMQWPLDDPACGQLDLDFGASPNLFPDGHGGLLVGDLQKSGTYHVAHAGTMTPAWHTLIGGTCVACNAASTAYDGRSIYAVSTPGGVLWSLDAATGARLWATPVADGLHYQSVSQANGVVYTVDGNGFLDAYSAADGMPVLRRSMSADVGDATGGLTSVGVAIAEHTVYAAATSASGSTGYLVAYRAP